mgnify:CR=1 FL=1
MTHFLHAHNQYNRGIFFIVLFMVYSLLLIWIKPDDTNLYLANELGKNMGVNCEYTETGSDRAICAHYCTVLLKDSDASLACMLGVYETTYKERNHAQDLVDPTVRKKEAEIP